MTAHEWLATFAARLGVPAPDQETIDALLAIAGDAAHQSERIAAPVACYLVGISGRAPLDVRPLAAGPAS
jgi:Domain of unknown function (DUF6457)